MCDTFESVVNTGSSGGKHYSAPYGYMPLAVCIVLKTVFNIYLEAVFLVKQVYLRSHSHLGTILTGEKLTKNKVLLPLQLH